MKRENLRCIKAFEVFKSLFINIKKYIGENMKDRIRSYIKENNKEIKVWDDTGIKRYRGMGKWVSIFW